MDIFEGIMDRNLFGSIDGKLIGNIDFSTDDADICSALNRYMSSVDKKPEYISVCKNAGDHIGDYTYLPLQELYTPVLVSSTTASEQSNGAPSYDCIGQTFLPFEESYKDAA